jgi:NADH-quinone oxidoreductase subunit N
VIARSSHDARHSLDDYRGMFMHHPVLASLLTFFLLAQAGVPFTGGFVAKLNVFAAAVESKEYWLAIVGVLAAVVAAFFYLRIVITMFIPRPEEETAELDVKADRRTFEPYVAVVLGVAAVMTLLIGVIPGTFLDWARDATFI